MLAEHDITLYTIECKLAIIAYCDFFMACAFRTSGQYVPLDNCTKLLSI